MTAQNKKKIDRVIKFRAWSKRDRCWTDAFCIHQSGMISCLISPDGDAHWDEEKEDLIIMQFTGLTDKNGIDIYESDLVERGSKKGEIAWDDYEARFRIYCGNVNYPVDSSWKIIGNKYEN